MTAEAIHKIMLSEVAAHFHLQRSALVPWLKKHSSYIAELSEFHVAAAEFSNMNLTVLPANARLLEDAADVARRSLLLTNDATIVALMRRHGLRHLATNDDDFDEIPDLVIWKPR